MTRDETAACYALALKAHRQPLDPDELDAWQLLLGDIDGTAAMAATRRLCLRPGQWPPTPGDIASEVARATGTTPPAPEVALGHYLAGRWDAHPAVERAARAVYWDRSAAPDAAAREFRRIYAAETDAEVPAGRRALGAGPPRALAEVLAEVELEPGDAG